MNRLNNFATSLPDGYVLVKHVDAKHNGKLIAVYSLLSFVPFVIILPLLVFIAIMTARDDIAFGNDFVIALMIGYWGYILYIILHELTHGITYKYYTGQKLTFGLTLTVAFCGVPHIFVRKRASIAALVMPFCVFSVIFLGLTVGLWFLSPIYGIVAGAVFALHLGGCVGDLHWIIMYLTKFRKCDTLMRDTGPEQWLYIPAKEAEKYGIPIIELAAA